jgi:tetratricopeptide (TPR) repeat protein
MMPSVAFVTGRISAYNKKMDVWHKRDSQAAVLQIPAGESEKMVGCFRELQKILNGYNRLHETLLRQASLPVGTGMNSPKEIYGLQQDDITFMDGFCGQMVASDGAVGSNSWEQGNTGNGLSPVEVLIARHAANREYEELVQAWQQMPAPAAAQVSLQTKILYGNALIALQRDEDATQVYRLLVEQMAPADGVAVDILAVRKTLADLYFATRNYREAESQYMEISKSYKGETVVEDWAILQRALLQKGGQSEEELHEYTELLRNYLGFDPAKDGYTVVWQADKFLQVFPKSAVALNVDFIRTAVREQADQWAKSNGGDAAALAGQQQGQGAGGEVMAPNFSGQPSSAFSSSSVQAAQAQSQIPPEIDSGAVSLPVANTESRVEDSREIERRWSEGQRLMAEAQYDKAIEMFTPLLNSQEALKAEKKIAEASTLAAEAERRRAADIFIRFTKATDSGTRKKLLVESRRILLDILVKYPGVDITDKVVGNIKRVEKEIDAIDPSLLQSGAGGRGAAPNAHGGPALSR